MDYYNRHYIRLDAKSCIVKGFSDAFEQPEDGDICINQEGGRHFELLGQVNPSLFNIKGQPIFMYEKEIIRELTAEEQSTLYPAPVPQPSELDVLKQKLTEQQASADNAIAELTILLASTMTP